MSSVLIPDDVYFYALRILTYNRIVLVSTVLAVGCHHVGTAFLPSVQSVTVLAYGCYRYSTDVVDVAVVSARIKADSTITRRPDKDVTSPSTSLENKFEMITGLKCR